MVTESFLRSPSPSGRGAGGEGVARALSFFLTLPLVLACAPDLPPALETPPVPDLSRVEPAVREQLGDERERLDALAGDRPERAELAAAYGRMGQLYHAYELLPEASACYRNALRLSPRPQWRYHLAGVYRRQGRLDDAAAELEAALREAPDDAPLNLRLGQIELARDHPGEARRHFEQALAAEPGCGAARYGLGEAARAEGDLEGAAEHFRRTLAEQPHAVQVLYPLGQTLQRLGRADEAAGYLARSAERRMSVGGRPTCPDPWDEELAGLTRSAAAHLTRGLHAAYAGRHDDALAEYRKALQLAPDDPVVRQSLGSALASAGDLEGAFEQYTEAVRLAPDDPDLNHDSGVVAAGLGRLDAASRHLEKALELRADFPAARLQLAGVEQRAGRFARALELYEEVLEADPANDQARLGRVRCLLGLGRRAEVVTELGRLLDQQPPADPGERLRLAMLLAGLGDVDRARRHFAAVLELDAPAQVHAQARAALGRSSPR